jgi:Transposase
VVEIERPRRGERRRGKSDPIDAHLAALHALHLDADRLPTPRADREALPILLRAHRELTTAKTRTINRLRALLLTGSDADRALSRGGQHQTPKHAIRRAEARRLALAISGIDRDLGDNKCHLAELVTIVACDGHGPSVGLYVARASGVRISMEVPWRCNRGYVAGRWVWSNAAAKSRVRGWKLCPAACLRQSVGPHLRRPHPLPPALARPAARPGRRMRRRRRRGDAWW